MLLPARKILLALLLLALVLRLGAAAWWQWRLPPGVRFGFPDSESYWQLAEQVAQGGPYQNNPDRRVFRTPGYPLLLAPLFVLAGGEPPPMAARILGAVLGTATVAGIASLAWLLFGRSAGLLAAAAATFYPGAIAMSVFVLSEAPFCPLMILNLVLCTLAWRSTGRRQAVWAGAAGIVAGLATLMRPSWLMFTPLALACALAYPGRRRQSIRLGLWMLLALSVTMAPWWVRNWRVTGSFVPTTLQVGESLYDGLGPQARGGSDMQFVDEFRQQLRAEDVAGVPAGAKGFEQRLDQRMRAAAWRWARANPGAALRLALVKFQRMWSPWPNEPGFRKFALVVAAGYTPLLICGLYGAWRYARRDWPYLLCVLPAGYFTLLHVIFVGSLRYRQPAMLALIVLAAGAVAGIRRNGETGSSAEGETGRLME